MGRVGTIFNPPFPVLKAGHSVTYMYMYSCICDVGFFLFFLENPVWLVCYIVFMSFFKKIHVPVHIAYKRAYL